MDTKVQKNWDADYRDRPPSLRLPGDTIKDQIIFNLVKKEDNKDGLLLELGCGLGHTASLLSRAAKVIGIDSSYEGVYRTSRRVRGHFICADARYLPFKEQIFDFIVAKDIFEHFDDDILAFRELARVSKSKAKLISYLPHELKGLNFSIESIVKKCIGYTLDADVGHIRRYTIQDIRRILSGLNFSVINFWYFAHFILGAIGLLGVSSYKKIKQKKDFFSPGKTSLLRIFFKLIELSAYLEGFIFKRIPGAGFFLIAQKH